MDKVIPATRSGRFKSTERTKKQILFTCERRGGEGTKKKIRSVMQMDVLEHTNARRSIGPQLVIAVLRDVTNPRQGLVAALLDYLQITHLQTTPAPPHTRPKVIVSQLFPNGINCCAVTKKTVAHDRAI